MQKDIYKCISRYALMSTKYQIAVRLNPLNIVNIEHTCLTKESLFGRYPFKQLSSEKQSSRNVKRTVTVGRTITNAVRTCGPTQLFVFSWQQNMRLKQLYYLINRGPSL